MEHGRIRRVLTWSHPDHTPHFVGPEFNRITSATHTFLRSLLCLAGSFCPAALSPPIPAAGFVFHPEVLLPVLRKEHN